MESYNKDFYEDLPGMVCYILDRLIIKYGTIPEFKKAWEEYRQHINLSSFEDMRMPGYTFNKYIDKWNEKISEVDHGMD